MAGQHFYPDPHLPRWITQPLNRAVVLVALAALLAITSSIIVPDQSQGNTPLHNPTHPNTIDLPSGFQSSADPRPAPAPDSLIGELVGSNYRIRIYAAYPEPLYTIIGMTSDVEAVALTAAEVALQFPSLPLLLGSFQPIPPANKPSADLPLLSDMPLDQQH